MERLSRQRERRAGRAQVKRDSRDGECEKQVHGRRKEVPPEGGQSVGIGIGRWIHIWRRADAMSGRVHDDELI